MAKTVGSRATSDRTAAKQRLLSYIHVDDSPVGARMPAPAPAPAPTRDSTGGTVIWAGGTPASVATSFIVDKRTGYANEFVQGEVHTISVDGRQIELVNVSKIKKRSATSATQRGMGIGAATHRLIVEAPFLDVSVSVAKPAAPSSETPAQDTLEFTTWSSHLIVRRGISSKVLGPLAEYLGLGKADVADFLDLDRGTAHRRAQADQPLPTYAAEGMLRLLEIDRMARDVFATDEDVTGWLHKPHPMLDDQTPLEAAKTSFGAERVKELLTAMKWGGVL